MNFHLEFLVGLERFALKVELDVPGELRAKPAAVSSGNASAPGRHAPP